MDPAHEQPLDAQAEALLRHAAWIRALARGLVADAASAEDVVQDTWVAALRGPAPSGAKLQPWLRTVVRNAAWQGFRRRGRREEREAAARAPEPLATPDELAERLETERRLTDELARLAEPYRSTLMLRYYEGLEPSAIAQRLALPAGTVRWRVKRGLELLRERLDQSFGKRAHWCALVLPLAGTRELALASTAAGAVVLPGVVAMNVFVKLALGAAAVVALAVALGVGGVLPESVWPFVREAPLALAARPYVPAPRVEAPSVPATPAEGATRALVALDAPVTAPAVVDAQPTIVEARIVDSAGTPFAGARLADPEHGQAGTSARDGRVRIELAAAAEPYSATFELGAPGYASQGLEAVVAPGALVHLGTLTLVPGGAVSGRVVDVDGRPIAGASITSGDVAAPRRNLEQERLNHPGRGVPSAVTGADGTFTLAGMAAGHARVWAWSGNYLASYSPPIEVHAGEERYGLELVLERVPEKNRIALLVVDPAGAPVPRAALDFRQTSESTGNVMAGQREADGAGRFEFVVLEDTQLAVTARDPERRFAPASAEAVRTGGAEVVLRLGEAAGLTLTVTGAGGAPVESFGFALLAPEGELEHQSEARAPRPGGTAEVRLPSEPFVVRVDAPGHELALVGPFTPGTLGETLAVVLVPVTGIHGRVLSQGAPLANARVRMHALVAEESHYVKNGFPSAWISEPADEVESDAEGRFLLTPRAPGKYAVRAEHEGLAPAISAAFTVDALLGGPDLELELGPGGAIEGRVVAPAGVDPAGTIVGLSRGDGYDRTLRVAPGGAYRFDRLTPGPWRLLAVEAEIQPGRVSITSSDRRHAREPEWSCTVRAGETSVCDLALADAELVVLTGKLTIDGRVPAGFRAQLVLEEEFFAQDPEQRVAIAADGSFRLTAGASGSYWLVLTGPLEPAGEQYLLDVLALVAGTQTWEHEFKTGTLIVTGAPPWDGEGIPTVVHHWKGPGRKHALTVLSGNSAGEASAAVPSGPGRLTRPDLEISDFDRWATLVTVDVPRGGEVTTRLP